MQQAKYPPTVVLKKNAIVGAAAISALLVILVVYNLYSSLHTQARETREIRAATAHTMADADAMAWFTQRLLKTYREQQPSLSSADAKPPVVGESTDLPPVRSEADVKVEEGFSVQQAMAAPITSNQLVAGRGGAPSTTSAEGLARGDDPLAADAAASLEKPSPLEESQNAESSIQASSVSTSTSPYVLQAGTVIPSILLTGITANLPKYVIGQVRHPVYDSQTGHFLLIPQGAKLIGTYDAQVSYGQERLGVTWQRLLLPNGQSIRLQDMPGVDEQGAAGLTDQVNAHYGKLATGALLSSVLGVGALVGASSTPSTDMPVASASIGALYAQSAGNTVLNTGNAWAEKQLAVQPTLTIRPGYLFNVMVTHDIVFAAPYANQSD